MIYICAIYKINERRDAFPSIPYRELMQHGYLTGMEIGETGLPHSFKTANEIRVEAEFNDILQAIIPLPYFIRCGSEVFLTGAPNDLDIVREAFKLI